MYCRSCGKEIEEQDKFCPGCGLTQESIFLDKRLRDAEMAIDFRNIMDGFGIGVGLSFSITLFFLNIWIDETIAGFNKYSLETTIINIVNSGELSKDIDALKRIQPIFQTLFWLSVILMVISIASVIYVYYMKRKKLLTGDLSFVK